MNNYDGPDYPTPPPVAPASPASPTPTATCWPEATVSFTTEDRFILFVVPFPFEGAVAL